ncbi:AAA family ATPase, partial [archaeon]
ISGWWWRLMCARTRAVRYAASCPSSSPGETALQIFAGPPGTGKTTTARIIAALCDKPLVVLNFENFASPYHGESERGLQEVLDAVSKLDVRVCTSVYACSLRTCACTRTHARADTAVELSV